jgi:hypothetical protein
MSTPTTSTIKASALNFHNGLIKSHGVEAASGFSDRGRWARFEVVRRCLNEFPDPRLKLLDYGCYDGELFAFLKTGLGPHYVGVDVNPTFIAHARKRWKDYCKGGRTKFILGDVRTEETFSRIASLKPDVIVASGVLCYTEGADSYPELVSRLFTCAKQALIFNVLVNTRPKNKAIYVWNKGRVVRLIEACGCRSWEIIRSYLHNDMTVVMRKKLTHYEEP